MSKKDFIALAAALKDTGATLATCKAVAEVCRVHGGFTGNGNRSFDGDLFMSACGYSGARS